MYGLYVEGDRNILIISVLRLPRALGLVNNTSMNQYALYFTLYREEWGLEGCAP